jgi:tetratricopeptide (TPR) repeat protein
MTAPSAPSSSRLTILAAGLIALAAIAAYHNSFSGTMAYDDQAAIVDNPTIRQLWPPWQALSPPRGGETVSGRPLVNLSLAINYAISGLKVWSYHATNLLIHIAAALVLFGILRRTFLMGREKGSGVFCAKPGTDRRLVAGLSGKRHPTPFSLAGPVAMPLALASALVWTVHPLQTESVTYIIQRAESLMSFCYLLTLYCVIRGAGEESLATSPLSLWERVRVRGLVWKTQTTARVSATSALTPALSQRERGILGPCPLLWYAAAVAACLLGMACKEVMVTAPLLVLLYDRTFLAGSFAEAWRRRWGLYLGLAATWGLLAYLVFSTGLVGRQSELGAPDAWSYARSQPGVILHYLRLSVWPSPLCLDYAWPVAVTLAEILPGVIVVGLLLAATVWGTAGRKAWGLLGAWFLLILAPTSSVLPLGQLAFEHRMYLSLAAVVVLAVVGGYAWWERLLFRPVGQGGQSPFSPGMTPGEVGLWGAKKGTVPGRAALVRWAAPAAVLAGVLAALGWATAARNADYRSLLVIWQDTVDKRPQNPVAHYNLATVLDRSGKVGEAIEHYRAAVRLKPDYVKAHNNLGAALAVVGKTSEAIKHYQEALRLEPDNAEARSNLGLALAAAGRSDEAIEYYRQLLRRNPEDAAAHNNLALVLAGLGRTEEAIEHYQEALRLKPEYAEAHNNLGNALDSLGKIDEAIEHYQQALRLKPDYAEAHNNLATVLAGLGKTGEAIEHYQQALRLKPGYAEAHNNLARALAGIGKTDEAIAHYDQALRLRPDFAAALDNLAWLLATRKPSQGGDPARAVRLAQRARELAGRENAQYVDTLAAAYAAAGRFSDAVVTAERAAELAESTGQVRLAKGIRARLELYRADEPYRETPLTAAE